jgi:hypothetical protein
LLCNGRLDRHIVSLQYSTAKTTNRGHAVRIVGCGVLSEVQGCAGRSADKNEPFSNIVTRRQLQIRPWSQREAGKARNLKFLAMAIGIDSQREEQGKAKIAAEVHHLLMFLVESLYRHVPATPGRETQDSISVALRLMCSLKSAPATGATFVRQPHSQHAPFATGHGSVFLVLRPVAFA